MSLLAFCEWLAATNGSIALHESLYMYPMVESIHVLALCLFVGLATIFDLRLLGLIRTQSGGEACTCDLTEPLGLTQPTVTHHLKVLFEAGFLERERRGRQTYYRIAPGSMTVLCQALDPSPELLPV